MKVCEAYTVHNLKFLESTHIYLLLALLPNYFLRVIVNFVCDVLILVRNLSPVVSCLLVMFHQPAPRLLSIPALLAPRVHEQSHLTVPVLI